MWTKVISFLFDAKNQRFLLLAGLVIALFLGFQQCEAKKEYKAEVQKQKNNIEALNDSVRYYENEAGELTAQKRALETDKEQLKTLNENLHEELEKERDRVKYLSEINAELKADSTKADTTSTSEIGNEHWRFDWNLTRSGQDWKRVLAGYTEFNIDSTGTPYNPNTEILKDLIRLKFITGITESDGTKEIFVRSSYPNLKVRDIEGAIIDEEFREESEPSRFGIGLGLGYGYTPDGFQPTVSLNLNYNLITF